MSECVINTSKLCPKDLIAADICSRCTIPDLKGIQCVVNLRIRCPDHKVRIRDEKLCKVCQIPHSIEKAAAANRGNFKIKFNGMSLKVAELKSTDTIDDRGQVP